MRAAEHAVPAYVPEARGSITHDVVFEYPAACGEDPVMERVPCRGLCEAELVRRTNVRMRMRNVRIVERVRS